MIKPASQLPWSKELDCTHDCFVIGKVAILAVDDGQDAEYIKVACNEFPALVEKLSAMYENLDLDFLSSDQIYDFKELLKRCGVGL